MTMLFYISSSMSIIYAYKFFFCYPWQPFNQQKPLTVMRVTRVPLSLDFSQREIPI